MGATDLSRLSRRDFLKNGFVFGAGAAGLAAGYAAVPDVFARAVYAGKKDGVMNDRVLVMIQLAGGADGLQTVIPMNDPNLHNLRPTLSRAADTALPLGTTGQGLNRSMRGIKTLYDAGKVAIVQGVGYPKPNFSHFDSIRIWETGDPERKQQDGWLGKTIAANYDPQGHPRVGTRGRTQEDPGAHRTVSGVGAKLLPVPLGGFPAHDQEFARHESLMGYVDSAISAFHADLTAYGMADRVLIATWSEFGRRAQETGNAGTDHGTAAPMLLIGDTVKGGLYGESPSLAVGRDGNLKYGVDFRAVYQEILESHMKVDAREVISQRFERIPAVAV